MTAQHATIGPSALYRLMACPGAYNMAKAIPQKGSSVYASEGSVVHAICEEVLTSNDPTLMGASFIGEEREDDGHTFTVDEDMAEAVDLYVAHCRSLVVPGSIEHIEERIDLGPLWEGGPPEPIFGTSDHFVYNPATKHLAVTDLKYGRGDVEPDDNPQAMAYALGAMLRLRPAIVSTVDIYIVQPRGASRQGIKHWHTTGLDLIEWGDTTLKPAVERMRQPNAPLKAGGHCRFCPGMGVCPALLQIAQSTSKTQFDPIPPRPEALTDEELASILDRAELLDGWVSAVRAEASRRIDLGKVVPGYKLVPMRAMRKWADPKEAQRMMEDAGLLPEAITKSTLLSPTQIEKKFGPVYKRLAEAGAVSKSSSGTTLVSDHDPREALVQARARDQFTPLE